MVQLLLKGLRRLAGSKKRETFVLEPLNESPVGSKPNRFSAAQ